MHFTEKMTALRAANREQAETIARQQESQAQEIETLQTQMRDVLERLR